jgi:hypothetical protein
MTVNVNTFVKALSRVNSDKAIDGVIKVFTFTVMREKRLVSLLFLVKKQISLSVVVMTVNVKVDDSL